MKQKNRYTKPEIEKYGDVKQLTEKKGPEKLDGHQGERSELG